MSQPKAVETSREALQKWANDVFTLLNLGDHAHQRNTFVAVLAECGENLLRGQGRLSPEAVPEREWLERIHQYVTGEAGSMHASLSSAQILHDIHEMTESALEGKSTKLTPSSATPEQSQQPPRGFLEALERAAKHLCVSLGRDDDYPAIDGFKQIIGEEMWGEFQKAKLTPSAIPILQEALELLALDEEECGCEHDTKNCCVRQGVFCHRCLAESALVKSGLTRVEWNNKNAE